MNKIKNVENYLKNLLFSGEITIEELENLSVRLRDELKQPKKKNASSFSEVEVGWYAFAGGKFSPDSDAYPNCQGVVGWVNPDKNAPEGQRGLIITPDEVEMMWSDKYYETNIKDEYDGKGNTEKLIAYGKKCKINFPAAEWCVAYCKNGVRPGEGFMPAKEQLKRIVANRMIVNPALQKIDGSELSGWIWSSSEYAYDRAWVVGARGGNVYDGSKYAGLYVRCVLAF